MAKSHQNREGNHQWKGGRVLASNGYVLIKVGFDHHLADVRGYAYEHRLVAEQKIGRRLADGEQVHHINEIKHDNRPENLEVFQDGAHHLVKHRQPGSIRKLPDEENPNVLCACGCGASFPKFDESKRPRRFISGHNHQSAPTCEAILWHIENVPMPATLNIMEAMLEKPRRLLTVALSKLKRKGILRKVGNEWRLADGRDPQNKYFESLPEDLRVRELPMEARS